MSPVRSRGMLGLCLTLAAVFVSGCSGGPDVAKVTGRVTLDGKPLQEAFLQFIPSVGGRPGTAMTDADGRYELTFIGTTKGAMIGPNRVKISTGAPETYLGGQFAPARPERLPKRYHEQTELTADVKPGGNVCDFNLESK